MGMTFITVFPAPLPSLEKRGVGLKVQASTHGSFFLETSSYPGAVQESPRVASAELEMLLVFLSLRSLQGIQEPCARNQGQRPVYTFSVTSHGGSVLVLNDCGLVCRETGVW